MGLSEALNIPFDTTYLKRTVNSVSQTRKSRIDRYDNVENAFAFVPQTGGKQTPNHVLLVDDVITTGATIAAAAQQLIDGLGCTVSIVTIARA